jgi:hypothetical protein
MLGGYLLLGNLSARPHDIQQPPEIVVIADPPVVCKKCHGFRYRFRRVMSKLGEIVGLW